MILNVYDWMSVDYVYGLFAYLRIVQSMDWVSSVRVCESWVEWFQSHCCFPARPDSRIRFSNKKQP